MYVQCMYVSGAFLILTTLKYRFAKVVCYSLVIIFPVHSRRTPNGHEGTLGTSQDSLEDSGTKTDHIDYGRSETSLHQVTTDELVQTWSHQCSYCCWYVSVYPHMSA